MGLIEGAGAWTDPDATGATYEEQFRSADLSVGTYCLPDTAYADAHRDVGP